MSIFDISRNEEIARRELTQQSKTLTLLRPLAELLNLRLKGESGILADCDILAATMWLFDNMMYFETRANCPGTKRQEAEALLVNHFTEAHPQWDESKCARLAHALFSTLTPREGFKKSYYDFCQQTHTEYFFRLIEWEANNASEVLYKLTPESMILYATRLEEGGLEHATVSAIRAERTLRRNEINLAIDAATQTVTQLQQFRLRINAGLRAARMGDTSFSFLETMKPLLEDAYDLLDEILNLVIKALDTIQSMRKNCTLEKRKKLNQAESKFSDIKQECRHFKVHISTVHSEFDSYRMEIIGLRETPACDHDLTASVIKPLLSIPIENAAKQIDSLVSIMLPPTLLPKNKRKFLYSFDLHSVVNAYHQTLTNYHPTHTGDAEGETQPYVPPPPTLSEPTIQFANSWVNQHLQQHSYVYFSDVMNAYDAGRFTAEQALACLYTVGALATSDRSEITIDINGTINGAHIQGDNLGVKH